MDERPLQTPALEQVYLVPPELVEPGSAPLLDDNGQPLRGDDGRVLYAS